MEELCSDDIAKWKEQREIGKISPVEPEMQDHTCFGGDWFIPNTKRTAEQFYWLVARLVAHQALNSQYDAIYAHLLGVKSH